jgi:Holliday junction resolvase|tara:strand:+ start:431 stop:793 length:363 start_codon:yes stop_codon:yes gene_type:complete
VSSRNKRRGYELEKEVQDFWTELGVPCKRVLGSGAFKNYSADLAGDVNLNGLLVECKRRKGGSGFKSLYDWFKQDDADLLVVRADRQQRLYIIPEPLMALFAVKMGWVPTKNEQGEIDNA